MILNGWSIDPQNVALALHGKASEYTLVHQFCRGWPLKKDQDELRAKIAELKQQHRDLDAEIEEMLQSGDADQINLQRLKKHKLHLKDRISTLENQLLPDIIA